MFQSAAPEIQSRRAESPNESNHEAQLSPSALSLEAQSSQFVPQFDAANANPVRNLEVAGMLAGFTLANAFAQDDNLPALSDGMPQQPLFNDQSNQQFAQNDGPLGNPVNALGVLANVLQGLSDVGAGAAGADEPPPPSPYESQQSDPESSPPPAPSYDTPSDAPPTSNSPDSGGVYNQSFPPAWMLNFMN